MRIASYIQRTIRKILASKYGWHGDYSTWKDARSRCSGYDANEIFEKVAAATLKVKNKEAAYERDSVLFDEIQYSWPLLSVLMWVSALNKGKLNVVDFGGSLGSSYFQNKIFLDTIDVVKWNVIEQDTFVKLGRASIQDDRINFFYDINEALENNGMPDVLLVSCTLPYLDNPYSYLSRMMEYKIPFLIIDNTPFNYQERDRITIQTVHPSIYNASYPCWLLNFNKLLKTVENFYEVVTKFENDSYIYVDGRKIKYRGFLAKLKA